MKNLKENSSDKRIIESYDKNLSNWMIIRNIASTGKLPSATFSISTIALSIIAIMTPYFVDNKTYYGLFFGYISFLVAVSFIAYDAILESTTGMSIKSIIYKMENDLYINKAKDLEFHKIDPARTILLKKEDRLFPKSGNFYASVSIITSLVVSIALTIYKTKAIPFVVNTTIIVAIILSLTTLINLFSTGNQKRFSEWIIRCHESARDNPQ